MYPNEGIAIPRGDNLIRDRKPTRLILILIDHPAQERGPAHSLATCGHITPQTSTSREVMTAWPLILWTYCPGQDACRKEVIPPRLLTIDGQDQQGDPYSSGRPCTHLIMSTEGQVKEDPSQASDAVSGFICPQGDGYQSGIIPAINCNQLISNDTGLIPECSHSQT